MLIAIFQFWDVFVKVACHLARGGNLEVIGKSIEKVKELIGIRPVVNQEANQIIGNVIYIDNYGNVVCNITKTLFEEIGKGRSYRIMARTASFTEVHNNYSEAINFDLPVARREEDGKKLALWNSGQYLELAIYKSNPTTVGSAATLFGLEFRDTVTINFN